MNTVAPRGGVKGPAAGGSRRYHKAAGERDQLWILDVEGQTTVVNISWAASAPAEIRDELFAMVETLEIQTP